jgi:hypothetical protein
MTKGMSKVIRAESENHAGDEGCCFVSHKIVGEQIGAIAPEDERENHDRVIREDKPEYVLQGDREQSVEDVQGVKI